MPAFAKLSFWDRHISGRMRLMRKAGLREVLSPREIHECNICGYKGAFSPIDFDKRQCPACKSANCHRAIFWFLQNEMPDVFDKKMSFLHFAPEFSLGRVLKTLPNLGYETADIAAKGVDHHFDLQTFDGPLGPFDTVMANHVLEHIPDDRASLRNIFRMVAPGGLAIFTVPSRDSDISDDDPSVVDPAERTRRYGQADHLRLYGRDLKDRIAAAGFIASIWQPPPNAPAQRFTMEGELIFLGRKAG
jgi:SAM-dependent methyltransferase